MNAIVKDCWNVIGVRGDASCAELTAHVHCRNCPIYSNAAANLLDGEPPADYIAHWTEQARKHKGAAERAELSVLLFRIGSEWLALPTGVLAEIASVRPVHSIPHRRNGVVLGLANIRGTLLVCISLRDVLSVDTAAPAEPIKTGYVAARFVVIQRDGQRVVCPVDEVHGIERFSARDLGSVPATVAGAASRYTRAVLTWQAKTLGLLDEHALFQAVNRSLS